MSFAPCPAVGGKRFSFLSKYLSQSFAEYHVLALREKTPVADSTAFRGNVHRVGMFPYHSQDEAPRGFRGVFRRAWKRWLCLVDPYVGWVIPAIVEGIRLHKKYHFNVVIVTVPSFSALIAATVLSRRFRSSLIIDYRDPWTNHRSDHPKPFGRWLCPAIERTAIKEAEAVVFCSDIMRDEFMKAFSDIAPSCLEVIYNGFEEFDAGRSQREGNSPKTMLYAGRLYGTRRLDIIAPALAQMLKANEVSAEIFQFHLYTPLKHQDALSVEEQQIGDLIHVHKPVPYEEIRDIMARSDILFLPSGDGHAYAVPFKFFDYLSVRRPILAIAPKESSVRQLMRAIDCGEFAEFGDTASIVRALRSLICNERSYTFAGAEQFRWERIAERYIQTISRIHHNRAR
jgi:glycosyltransferase involved in cell wall biosynthesis